MKRSIFLNLAYESGPAARSKAIQKFREDLKALPLIKILKEFEKNAEVIIEYPDEKSQEIYEALCKLDIVEIIDSILPPGEQ